MEILKSLDWNSPEGKIIIGIIIFLITSIIGFIFRKFFMKLWNRIWLIIPIKIISKLNYKIGDTISFNVSSELISQYPEVFNQLYKINEETVWAGEYQGAKGNFFFYTNSLSLSGFRGFRGDK